MKSGKKFRFTLPVLAISLFFISCATFREGKIPSYSGIVSGHSSFSKGKIALIIHGQLIDNGTEVPAKYIKNQYVKYWVQATEKAYKDQHILYTIYSAENKEIQPIDTGLISEVNIIVEKDYNLVLGFLSFLTLTFVPLRESFIINISTTIHDKSGTILKTYKRSEEVVTWNQLFMIFVMPFTGMHEFRDEGDVFSEIYYDANVDIIKEACRDGVY